VGKGDITSDGKIIEVEREDDDENEVNGDDEKDG